MPVWRGWDSNFLSKKKWVFKTTCKWLYATHEEPLGRWELLGSAEFLTSAAVTESKTADGHHHRCPPRIRLERDHNLHHENTRLGDLRRAWTVCRLGRRFTRSRPLALHVSTPVSPVRRRSLVVWFSFRCCGWDSWDVTARRPVLTWCWRRWKMLWHTATGAKSEEYHATVEFDL